jgi:hypothetical protein
MYGSNYVVQCSMMEEYMDRKIYFRSTALSSEFFQLSNNNKIS